VIGEQLVTAFGETKNVADWHRDPRCAVTYKTLYARLANLGWLPELAIITPRQRLDNPRDPRRPQQRRGLSAAGAAHLRQVVTDPYSAGF
jgi:hypothetical protein